MDDIKLYGKTEKEIKKLIDITAKFSKDINMEFGLDKCKIIHIIKGKIRPGDLAIEEIGTISAMEPNEFYKYLGYNQSIGIEHIKIKSSLKQEYKNRVNAICRSQLSGKKLIKAINTYAIPVLTYSFGIIKWTKTDINSLEINTRTILTKHNCLHPKSAIERMTLKRQNGGRGLINIQELWNKQINNLTKFFQQKARCSQIHKAITHNDKNFTPFNWQPNELD